MTCDLLVVGGGIMGLGVAWRMARQGLRVTVLERNADPGHEASWAAAGMLAPLAELEFEQLELHAFATRSQRLWPDLAAALHRESGIDPGLDRTGTLVVAVDRDDHENLARRADYMRRVGLPVEELSGDAAREREPLLDPNLVGALHCADDIQVDNRAVLRGLLAVNASLGVTLQTGCTVTHVLPPDATHPTFRVHDADGRVWDARQVLLAAGAWSRSIDGLRPRPPVRPVRGQMLSFRWPADTRALRHVIRGPDAYLVPKADRLVVGATSEERGFDRALTGGGLLQLLEGSRDVCPAVLEYDILETWTGFRPGSRDNLPILGGCDIPGLFFATGHYRNGIQLAAATLDSLPRALAGEPTPELDPFRISRFGAPGPAR